MKWIKATEQLPEKGVIKNCKDLNGNPLALKFSDEYFRGKEGIYSIDNIYWLDESTPQERTAEEIEQKIWKCLHCPHLDRKEIEFDTGISTYHGFEPVYRKAQTFYCKAKNILLLHPKTDYLKSDLSWVYLNEKETEQFPMLVDCEVYENDKNNNEIILQSLF